MSAVTPFLWFDDSAEEAVTFYTALIPDSAVVSIDRYPDEVPGMGGKVMHVHFRLGGRDYYGMDAGPQFPFTEAFSLYVPCRDQAEVDRYWDALTADGGQEQPCGWLKDRYGVSWQVIPPGVREWLTSPDAEARSRVARAVYATHGKLDAVALEKAYRG